MSADEYTAGPEESILAEPLNDAQMPWQNLGTSQHPRRPSQRRESVRRGRRTFLLYEGPDRLAVRTDIYLPELAGGFRVLEVPILPAANGLGRERTAQVGDRSRVFRRNGSLQELGVGSLGVEAQFGEGEHGAILSMIYF